MRRFVLAFASLCVSPFALAVVNNDVQGNFGAIAQLPFSSQFGDQFTAAGAGFTTLATSAAGSTVGAIDGSTVNVGGTLYNFYDDFEFSLQGQSGSLSASAVSVTFNWLAGINNLQARVYDVSASGGLTTAAPAAGASYAWSSALSEGNGVSLSITDFGAPVSIKAGDVYVLELRGTAFGAQSSYGGSVSIVPVPESDSRVLALAGLGVTALVVRRRFRA